MPLIPASDPLIVCGSGIAGLLLTLRAAEHGAVTLVTKDVLGAGSTARAQGGIAAALAVGDSPASHLADTLAAGHGLCDPAAAREVCVGGPAAVARLVELGVAFDRDPTGALRLALEGAHSQPRVAHAGGDATGASIVAALVAVVRAHPAVTILEGEAVVEIVVRDGVAIGVRTRRADGIARMLLGRAVALATGGVGQLFLRTTNPPGATGDGIALAARAGAALADLEFIQFHPTALALGDGPLPLISEAVRGAGARLRDHRGRPFLARFGIDELGPRDAVARAIYRQARDDAADVTLNLGHLDPGEVHARFPSITAVCREHGLDLARDPVPVTPAAHSVMGGVLADMAGRTTIPGLFAIGETAATGVHGANRLASNGLLEGAVMAERAAAALATREEWPQTLPAGPGRATPGSDAVDLPALRPIMWAGAGLERDAAGISAALAGLRRLPADDTTLVGRAILVAAAARGESRGAHFRGDAPRQVAGQARRVAWVGDVPHPLGSDRDQPRSRRKVA